MGVGVFDHPGRRDGGPDPVAGAQVRATAVEAIEAHAEHRAFEPVVPLLDPVLHIHRSLLPGNAVIGRRGFPGTHLPRHGLVLRPAGAARYEHRRDRPQRDRQVPGPFLPSSCAHRILLRFPMARMNVTICLSPSNFDG